MILCVYIYIYYLYTYYLYTYYLSVLRSVILSNSSYPLKTKLNHVEDINKKSQIFFCP